MAKKVVVNTFDDDKPLTHEDAFGALAGMTIDTHIKRNVLAKPIPILEIWPDPAQPRRTMPFAVRHLWNGMPETVSTVFRSWIDLAEKERNAPFLLDAYLNPDSDDGYEEADDTENLTNEDDVVAGPIEASLLKLVRLAASILHHDLTNPITVLHNNEQYQIETGERRWLAYHLLYAYTKDDKWSAIPARLMDKPSVWRQAQENAARENLNAISKARQLAILLIDLYDPEHQTFAPYQTYIEQGLSDREYYAQVADGQTYRIPYKNPEVLTTAMGLPDTAYLRRYRALLRLPDEVWTLADDHNWTEGRIRALIQAADNDENALIEKAQAEAAHDLVMLDTPTKPHSNKQPKGTPKGPRSTLLAPDVKKGLRILTRLSVDSINQAKPQARTTFQQEIQRVKEWLNLLEEALNQQSEASDA